MDKLEQNETHLRYQLCYIVNTRRMFDAKRQREAAIFRCTCRNKKTERLNAQTLIQFKLQSVMLISIFHYLKI